jgi:endonuclease YncB( thermonuclease family)
VLKPQAVSGRVFTQSDRLSWEDHNNNSHRFYDARAGLIMALCCGSGQVIMIDLMRLLIVLLLAFPFAIASAATLTGRTVRVTDGDTIVILSEGNVQHKIRLQGIDAPERGQAYGTKSKKHLSEWVAGRFVVVKMDKRDRYGRVIGKVLVGGKEVCLEQVIAGLAWHYKKYQNEQTASDRQQYADAESEARDAKRGLWQDPQAIAPWDYRAAKRK